VKDTSPIFKPPKSRALVSAWAGQTHADHALERVREFQDIFDQVIFMCRHVNADGSLATEWPALERKRLAAELRDMGVSTLNDYGGGEDTLTALTASPKGLGTAIANMVRECEETGADGVDIDFEHIPPHHRFAFTDFIGQLSEALHARGKMLSICTNVPSRSSHRDGGIGFLELPTLSHYVDHLRPMNYDLFGPWTPEVVGPTSTAPWAREGMTYLAGEVPKHKIVMGLPTYSLDFDLIEPSKSRQVYDYEWIAEREKASTSGRVWISHWDVSLIRYTDGDGHIHLLYVTDASSTKSHLETVDRLGLAGVCFWCLMGDDPQIWEAVRQHFGR
jgi:spore germination protein YaaH